MLNKYHKQKKSSHFRAHYKMLNDKYDLKYDIKEDESLIYLSVFEHALKQKQFFEQQFESVRNDCFDMWDHLSFYEKNDLILLDTNKKIDELIYFEVENVKIYIPFFNKMLNSLYATEIAVLEKPQFFRLYEEFKETLIDFKTYGIAPYVAGFSYCDVVLNDEETVILYDANLHVFYKINETTKRYPLLLKMPVNTHQKTQIAHHLLNNEADLYPYLIKEGLVSKRFAKKYQKLVKKGVKIHE